MQTLSDEALADLSKAAAGRFSWTPRNVQEKDQSRKATNRAKGPGQLSKDALDWLYDLSHHPFRQTTVRDRLLGFSAYRAKMVREQLEELGYVQRHVIGTGKRGGQFVLEEINDAGYEYLAQVQVPARKPPGKGGYVHKFWQYKVADWLKRNHEGARVKIEDPGSGKSVDVTLYLPSRDGEREKAVAYEINVHNALDDETGNGLKDLETGEFDQVVMCVDHWDRLESLKEKMMEGLGQEKASRIEFRLLAQFLD